MCHVSAHLTPFPRYSWCGFVSLGGFPRPIPNFSKYFLQQGDFLLKIWREFWGGSRASVGGCGWGVCRFDCLPFSLSPSLPAACPVGLWPAACSITANGKKSGFYGAWIGFWGLRPVVLAWVGFICLCAYLVKIETRGVNFQPIFLSLCLSFSRPVLSIIRRATTDNRTQKKKRPFIWSFLLGLYGVSPF